jgi:hypothetical protein
MLESPAQPALTHVEVLRGAKAPGFDSAEKMIMTKSDNKMLASTAIAAAERSVPKQAWRTSASISTSSPSTTLSCPKGWTNRSLLASFTWAHWIAVCFTRDCVRQPIRTSAPKGYRYYVTSALQNPAIIGAHWFQYYDEPATGRSDGENYQIGFLDICDTPYWETVAAAREVGYELYSIHSGAKTPER